MHTIHIRTISIETKIIYTAWVCFIVLVCTYLALIAGTMVYGVSKKTADRAAQDMARSLADHEAQLLRSASELTMQDAERVGLVHMETRLAVTGDVLLGRADR